MFLARLSDTCIIPLMDRIKWHWWNVKRLWRLLHPEPSAKLLIKIVGPWWLFFHGARREYRIYLWRGYRWYAADIAVPRKRRIVEAYGSVHYYTRRRDVIRESRLREKGWGVLTISYEDMLRKPRKVKRRVRRHLRGK